MSGLEVVGAVAAVVSAFHGGAELVAHIKKKHRRRSSRQTQQDFEEKLLQDSLESGEAQVGQRYVDHLKEFGDIIKVGDAVARDRLLHIAVVMQAEIIRSLKLAVKYENAVLNLNILHEASIMNRKDAIVTLDELKQRILITVPLPRTLPDPPEKSELRSSVRALPTVRTVDLPSIPDDYIPSAVTIPTEGGDSRELKTGLARYFSMKRSTNRLSSSKPRPASTPSNIQSSPALDHLLQGSNDRAAIMKDIDDIISSYQGLRIESDKRDTWAILNGGHGDHRSNRDTLAILNGGDYKRDTVGLNREALQMLKNLPATPEGAEENSEYPAFNRNAFDPYQIAFNQHFATQNKEGPTHVAQQSRWSASSSIYSEATTPSLYRTDSTSTRSGNSPTPPLGPDCFPHSEFLRRGSVTSTVPLTPYGPQGRPRTPNAPFVAKPGSQPPPIAPVPLSQRPILNSNAVRPAPPTSQTPFVGPQPPRTPPKDDDVALKFSRLGANIVPKTAHTRNKSAPGISMLASSASSIVTSITPPSSTLVPTLSQNPNGSLTIRSGSIQGPTAGQERMMDGRPCKDNNYWGFCKGAWAVREETKRGLEVQTRPDGMYNSHQIWQCKHCHFQGETFNAPHPTRKNKKEIVVDPSIHTSAVGIRYRWIFLAKSHVKKKTMESGGRASSLGKDANEECNYGCVICSNEGNVTGIYGNVETLMNHIFLEHLRTMNEKVAVKSKCIVGRAADAEEEWDINVPMADVLLA